MIDVSNENEDILDVAFSLDLTYGFEKFKELNMIKALTDEQKRALYDEMIEGTKKYLTDFKF